jgi:hypothetical protein
VAASAAVFSIDWDDLQLNLPILAVARPVLHRQRGRRAQPGHRVRAAGAAARRRGRVRRVRLHTRTVRRGSVSGGQSVADNRIPNTPEYTATLGAQLSRAVRPGILAYGRAETVFYGAFAYDEANLAEQDAYAIANFRAGARGRLLFAEAWVRNAFDTHYVPVAFAYGGLAPSGFIGRERPPPHVRRHGGGDVLAPRS